MQIKRQCLEPWQNTLPKLTQRRWVAIEGTSIWIQHMGWVVRWNAETPLDTRSATTFKLPALIRPSTSPRPKMAAFCNQRPQREVTPKEQIKLLLAVSIILEAHVCWLNSRIRDSGDPNQDCTTRGTNQVRKKKESNSLWILLKISPATDWLKSWSAGSNLGSSPWWKEKISVSTLNKSKILSGRLRQENVPPWRLSVSNCTWLEVWITTRAKR